MKKLLLSAALLIVLPLGSAYAVGMDDLTMQVIETNDSKELMHNVEIPDSDKPNLHEAKHEEEDVSHDATEAVEDASHEAAEDAKEAAHEAAENTKEDTKNANEHPEVMP